MSRSELPVRLTLAGSIIEPDGTERQIGGRHLPVLLALLAEERNRTVSRDELADALWDDQPPISWEASLRVAISKVRAFLIASGFEPTVLKAGARGYRLSVGDRMLLDLEAATQQVSAAEARLASRQPVDAAEIADRARAVLDRPFDVLRPTERAAGPARELGDGDDLIVTESGTLRPVGQL